MGGANNQSKRDLPPEPGAGGNGPPPDAVAVREQLQRILDSAAFRNSKRSQAFLRFVVEAALEGRGHTLKERTLAIEIFGRRQDADLGDDTIVRVSAREVRRRLAQYYAYSQAGADSVVIELPPGSYTPEFRPAARTEATGSSRPAQPAAAARGFAWVAVTVGVFVLLAAWGWLRPRSQADPFWEPFLSDPQPVLLGVAHPVVYHPSPRAVRLQQERDPLAKGLLQRPIELPPELLDGSDLVPVLDQYVGWGDLVAAANLSSYFGARKKPVKLRLASKLDFADLKDGPTILIGAYTNRWTIELVKNLRFRFARTSDWRAAIEDTAAPGTTWALPANRADGLTEEDYVLLARLLTTSTGKPLVLVAGLKHFGTEAGSSFLVHPQIRAELLSGLPENWRRRNLAIVLRARVYGNSPARPEVLRWHSW